MKIYSKPSTRIINVDTTPMMQIASGTQYGGNEPPEPIMGFDDEESYTGLN